MRSAVTTLAATLGAAFLFGSAPVLAADKEPTPPLGERLKLCATCHGQTGNGVETFPDYPKLAGQHPDYLAKALRDYRSGARSNAVMASQAKLLDPSEIPALAEYFAHQRGTLVVKR